ncbi:hypothetical protein [Leisingera aquaemixtae]|uniref:hypothetical protein n=1 Tax=Leisingera aquaemixtae TaxID=1396826 RepID=UPI002882FC0D|nr:hypothetical protein [Leisingera aquaemixtae]
MAFLRRPARQRRPASSPSRAPASPSRAMAQWGAGARTGLPPPGQGSFAVSDSRGVALLPDGLDPARLDAVKAGGESVAAYPGAAAADSGAVITADCDILVPAARPDVIRAGNADAIRARLVLEGANIPATEEAEQRLHARGITVVPDFIANAGGVICAAMELRGLSEPAAFETISSPRLCQHGRGAGASRAEPHAAARRPRWRWPAAGSARRWASAGGKAPPGPCPGLIWIKARALLPG